MPSRICGKDSRKEYFMNIYKNLIFDVGEVLLEYRWKDMLIDYGLSPEEAVVAGNTIFENNNWKELDIGTLSTEEIIELYSREFPQYKDLVRWFITHGELMHVGRPQVWERVHKLKEQGYHIYLLSNYSRDLFEKHTANASFLKDLDGMVISYQIHEVKPHPAIYQHLLNKYSLNPKDCLFFDDRADNTAAARDLGICAYTISSQEYLLGLLDMLLGNTGCPTLTP